MVVFSWIGKTAGSKRTEHWLSLQQARDESLCAEPDGPIVMLSTDGNR